MRFDDSLRTVLAADTATPFGAAAAWRQLVDLIGRGRAPASEAAMARLRAIRPVVPAPVRAASARALADAMPGAAMAALFAEDDPAIAAPVLRAAALGADEWAALLPSLPPAGRAVLRHRRDLPADVLRALDGYAGVDFVLEDGRSAPTAAGAAAAAEAEAAPARAGATDGAEPAGVPEGANGFPISDLVARIAAFQREREAQGAEPLPVGGQEPGVPVHAFRFETDADGAIRWLDGAPRAPLLALSIAVPATAPFASGVDGAVAGAFRRRSAFADGRLSVAGGSAAAGDWRISGEPRFEPASGRFAGYAGEARRPRADESVGPRSPAADGLRQLVHELRTPANAIAGFAELIEGELLGAVPAPYRSRAADIREQVGALVAAIDDLDTAARIDGDALELRPGAVPLAPLLARAVEDLAPLARVRGAALALVPVPPGLLLDADDRAAERLVGRLLAALLAAAGEGERLSVAALRDAGEHALIAVDRPAALARLGTAQLLALDAEAEAAGAGAPLLGTGFSLRLVQSLAAELGGALAIEPRRLTLRLPAVVSSGMDKAQIR